MEYNLYSPYFSLFSFDIVIFFSLVTFEGKEFCHGYFYLCLGCLIFPGNIS